MRYNKEIELMRLENRLSKLSMKPVDNAKLMNKVKRQIRKLKDS